MSVEFIITAACRATLLMTLGLVVLRCLPAERPKLRRALSLSCLAASLVLPFLPAPPHSAGLPVMSGAALPMWDLPRAVCVLAWLWLAGSVMAGMRLARRGLALRGWLSECGPLLLPASIAPSVPVRVCRRAVAPCVAGIFSPVLIVPTGAREWDTETWNCVLAHELQHVRQGDLWLGWITHAVRVLYWWNPLAWRLLRGVGLECEACCDDAVLRMGVKAVDYARVLLRFTTGDALPEPAGYSIRGKTASSLRQRLERMLGGNTSHVSLWRIAAVISLLVIGMGGCGWLSCERQPPAESSASGQAHEAALRWQANPFPADAP